MTDAILSRSFDNGISSQALRPSCQLGWTGAIWDGDQLCISHRVHAFDFVGQEKASTTGFFLIDGPFLVGPMVQAAEITMD